MPSVKLTFVLEPAKFACFGHPCYQIPEIKRNVFEVFLMSSRNNDFTSTPRKRKGNVKERIVKFDLFFFICTSEFHFIADAQFLSSNARKTFYTHWISQVVLSDFFGAYFNFSKNAWMQTAFLTFQTLKNIFSMDSFLNSFHS